MDNQPEKSLKQLKVEAQLEMNRLRSQEPAKDVASKYIGKYGLFYITLIVLIAVGSSAFLPEAAITAVMTMIGGALVAIITMLQGITGTQKKEEKPELLIIQDLVQRLDQKEPMNISVDKDKVIVKKGSDELTTTK
jgi:fructoselysine-6-P-deglycase FrlB-like protein